MVVHGSPGRRSFNNFLGDMKNEGGFVWPPEKAKKDKPQPEPEHDPATCLVDKGFDIEGLDSDDLHEFHQMAHDED